ncbi:FidL-like protein [Klebsiella oxytoca]|uniref:FidL-like protein n=1 Tax=Klebsiella oxytoca TaxID=571 RepID=UPI0022451ACF|nr:FidL-like protein [Klebsiella oxytoca]MCW9445977.1 FidL-like protein [Klebsiella oxytoca]
MNKIYSWFILPFILVINSNSVCANDAIFCEARHTLHHGAINIHAIYRFVLDSSDGTILLNGTIANEKENFTISREVQFTYIKQHNDNYRSKSKLINKNPIDNTPDELMRNHYPDFFINEEESLTFKIEKVNKTGLLISFISTPLFYCNSM